MKLLINTTNSEATFIADEIVNDLPITNVILVLDCIFNHTNPDIILYPHTDKKNVYVAELVDDILYSDLINTKVKIKLA